MRMGICYQGKTLKEIARERDELFKESGYAYGLESLELLESDPAKFMRFQMRLVAACINAREMAKLISANPMSLIQGELLFLLATPEGDVVSASYGLAGHVQAFPFMIKAIANLGFEDDPGISHGDVFFNNDAMYGAPHNADCYNFVPIFYEGELIGWTVGLNHIVDVGGLQPGGLGTISPSVFTDGFTVPPTKIGANFKTHRWWELHWKRRTRTEAFNVLDDKMRTAGCVTLHDRILEIVKEFGIDYFRQGLREIIERERRLLVHRIMTQAVPGKYGYLYLETIKYKGVVGKLFASSNKDWVLHIPVELNILSDGSLLGDLEGLTSEDDFHCNAYEPALRMLSSLGAWPMFAYTQTLNTALYYMTRWNLPPGSMFNPQNPFAATVMSLAAVGRSISSFNIVLSMAYFARGFLEECFPQSTAGVGYGLAGVMSDGFQWAGGDMTLITCWSANALPYKDGEAAYWCMPNPASDQGETELAEFLQPTQLNIGKKLIPDYCSHGKFRGGLGIGMCQMVTEPGQALIIAPFGSSPMGRVASGMCGGYPGFSDVAYFAQDTNMREILNEGKPYPRDFVEIREWIKEDKLKAGNVEVYQGSGPNVPCKDGDLFATASASMGGWGDPLEREYGLVENDIHYGWLTPNAVRNVYGAVIDDSGKVNVAASNELRQQMRKVRQEKSLDAGEWWKQEREKVSRKDFYGDIQAMYADCMKYEKFRNQFTDMWRLPEDFQL